MHVFILIVLTCYWIYEFHFYAWNCFHVQYSVSSSKIVFNCIYKYHLFDVNAEKHSLASLQRALRGSPPLVALATDIYACHVGKRGVLRVGTRLPVTPLPVENNAITGDLIGIFCEYFTLKFCLTHRELLCGC